MPDAAPPALVRYSNRLGLRSRCRVRLLEAGAGLMPSKSPAQHRLMMAAAHNSAFAAKAGVPQHVAKEFVAADAAKSKHKARGLSRAIHKAMDTHDGRDGN